MGRPKERTEYGQRLYEARKGAKLSQERLAELVGMGQSSLAEAESTQLGSSFTAQLAAATGVRAEWLASGVGPKFEAAVTAHEPEPEWPFPKVALSRVLALEEDDRGYVQRRLLQAIEECEMATVSVDEQRQAERILKPAKKSRSSVKKAA